MQENQRTYEVIREQLRSVLDRVKRVAWEGMGQAHTERSHGREHGLKPRDRGISYGL